VAALDGDLTEFWARHRCGELRFAEWRGASVFAFAATGTGVADYVQIALGREIEWLAGPIVDPDFRPRSVDDLLEPSWVSRDAPMNVARLAGPVYRPVGRGIGAGRLHPAAAALSIGALARRPGHAATKVDGTRGLNRS
jgi:hypothetical protein